MAPASRPRAGGRYHALRRVPNVRSMTIEEALAAVDDAVARVADRRFGRRRAGDVPLAAAAARLSQVYTRDRAALGDLPGDRGALEARLRLWLPRDLRKLLPPLAELHPGDPAPGDAAALRVLDLGAGLGAATLGATVFAASRGRSVVSTALDADGGALGLLADVARASGLPVETHPRRERLRLGAPAPVEAGAGFDLILVSLALNELLEGLDDDDAATRGADQLRAWCEALAPNGALVVIEPALRGPTRRLMAIRDALAAEPGPPHVFAPCTHGAPCPMRAANARDWCHHVSERPLPPAAAALARAAGLRDGRGTYAYLTLRRAPGRWAGDHRLVSAPRRSKGRVDAFACGDGALRRLVRLTRHRDVDAPALDAMRRGDLVRVPPAAAGREGKPLPPDAPVERIREVPDGA